MNDLEINKEFAQLRLRYRVLVEEVANQFEIYTHLVNTVGPNLANRYMILIGQFEYRIYELKVEVNRWNRRFALRQQAINRGRKPNLAAIEACLQKEFAAYAEAVRKHLAAIEEAEERERGKRLTDSETTAIRVAYLDAVKRLHPDLNGNLTERMKNLWKQIQVAYSAKDWKGLKFLCGLVADVVGGDKEFGSSPDSLTELRKQIERLEARSHELHERTKSLKDKKPFKFETFLKDPDAVDPLRRRLFTEIETLEKQISDYREGWEHVN